MTEELKPTIDELKRLFSYDSVEGILYRRKRNGELKVCKCKDTKGRYRVTIENRAFSVSHICWAMWYGFYPKDQIDHINNIKTDNRIINLRECSNNENARNRINYKNLAGKPKGVAR